MNERLRHMLSYKRPYKSKAEADWIKRFIMPYEPEVLSDKHGDPMVYIVQVNHEDGSTPSILFSAHTDTMHAKGGRQKLVIDHATGFVSKNDGEPLGADDAAGVWILLEMIDAKIPGVYTFPVGEERGGVGSGWLAVNCAEWLKGFDYAVAFDRKATHSIITHQGVGKCCSNAFAEALADALNQQDFNFMYAPDDTGVYTDTAEYVDLISECTNVSCGYYSEHTEKERLDYKHLEALRDACLLVNWCALPAERKPGDDGYMARSNLYPTRSPRWSFGLEDMTREEMIEVATWDPDRFVDMVRDELGMEDDVDFLSLVDENYSNVKRN